MKTNSFCYVSTIHRHQIKKSQVTIKSEKGVNGLEYQNVDFNLSKLAPVFSNEITTDMRVTNGLTLACFYELSKVMFTKRIIGLYLTQVSELWWFFYWV